jgi:hypothetical protein
MTMRVISESHGYTVKVSVDDVIEFKKSWPCSGLSVRGVQFTFDNNGDLVDSDDQDQHPRAEGSAIVALCADAQAFAKKKLNKL